jgi:predicted HicB family RNase H-like nuclease
MNNKSKKTVVFNVRVPEKLQEMLLAKAEESDMNISELVRDILRDAMFGPSTYPRYFE